MSTERVTEGRDVEGLLERLEDPLLTGQNGPLKREAAATIRALRSEVERYRVALDDEGAFSKSLTEKLSRKDAALRVLAAFARTAPGRLPAKVQEAVDSVPWENPDRALASEVGEYEPCRCGCGANALDPNEMHYGLSTPTDSASPNGGTP